MIEDVESALGAYITVARANGLSPKTVSWVRGSARMFAAFVGPAAPLAELTVQDYHRWLGALRDRRRYATHTRIPADGRLLSPTSIRTYARGLRNMFAMLAREEIIDDHPLAHVRLPKEPRLTVQPYTDQQMKAIFKALADTRQPLRNRAIVALLWDSCLRLTEAVTLRLDALNLDAREARVFGKGARERVVPLGAWATKQILLYLTRERPNVPGTQLFLDAAGAPLSPHGFQQVLKRLKAMLGFRVFAHGFRHTGAIGALRNGMDAFSVQRLLGHSSLATTKRYVALADSDVKRAHQAASVGDRLRP